MVFNLEDEDVEDITIAHLESLLQVSRNVNRVCEQGNNGRETEKNKYRVLWFNQFYHQGQVQKVNLNCSIWWRVIRSRSEALQRDLKIHIQMGLWKLSGNLQLLDWRELWRKIAGGKLLKSNSNFALQRGGKSG